MAKHKIFRKYYELLTGSPQSEVHGSAEYLFKCTEKKGFYSVSEPISEQDIISIVKQIVAAKFKRGKTITSSQASIGFLLSQIGHYEHEVFVALFLDSNHRIIKFE